MHVDEGKTLVSPKIIRCFKKGEAYGLSVERDR